MFRSKSNFERVFEKATSNLLLEPDLDSMLQLCDMIRGGEIKARESTALMINKIIEEKNPHVQYFAVAVLDTVMKNCGEAVHSEVLVDSYMESIKELVKSTKSENVKEKLLEMIQAWGVSFKDQPKLKVATNLYNIMKAEGYKFPPISDTSDMFKSEKAPTWSDGDECSKCKVEFGLVQRKHHCRACGGIFCNKCSSKQAIIPKYGIEKEVRVCDACFTELVKKSAKSAKDNDLPAEYLNSALSKQSQEPPKRDDAALKEEEDLQLALALSLDEQENKHRIRKEKITESVYATVTKPTSSPTPTAPHVVDAQADPDLARYLNRSYWDSKKQEQDNQKNKQEEAANSSSPSKTEVKSSKSNAVESSNEKVMEPTKVEESLQHTETPETTELLSNLRSSVEIFMNRMRSDEMRGRSIANDSTVQTLFQSINNMHPTLIQYMNDLEEKRLHQEALQDKLAQIRDARAALDALRAEHAEKLRKAAEEADRLRQIQMAQKLEVMRQKKQEYLAYQRQMALQRMQEQEAARQARLEQHKQMIQQKAMQPSMLIAGYNTQFAPQQSSMGDGGFDGQPQGGSYGGYLPQQQAYPVQGMAPQPQFNSGLQQATTGYGINYQSNPIYQQGMVNGQSTMQATTSTDAYNMADMNNALVNQPLPTGTVPTGTLPPGALPAHQVVATAPPPTPQPSSTPQQMMSVQMDTSGYQQVVPQQGYYQQQIAPSQTGYQDNQSSYQENQQQPVTNQDPLISFD